MSKRYYCDAYRQRKSKFPHRALLKIKALFLMGNLRQIAYKIFTCRGLFF